MHQALSLPHPAAVAMAPTHTTADHHRHRHRHRPLIRRGAGVMMIIMGLATTGVLTHHRLYDILLLLLLILTNQ